MTGKWKKCVNTLLVKILCTVIIGICCLSVGLSILNIMISRDVFVESFSESQKKIFTQIDEEFYQFFSDVTEITRRADTSWAVREYLTEENADARKELEHLYYMKRHLQNTKLDDYSSLGVMIVGTSGRSYIHNNARKLISESQMLEEPIAKKALENPKTLVCELVEKGYTDDSKNVPVIVMARTIGYRNESSYDGMIFLMMKESEFQKMYSYFAVDTNDIVILNQDNQVISSSDRQYLTDSAEIENIVQKVEMNNGVSDKYLVKKLQGTNYKMVGIIDPEEAFAKRYDWGLIVLMTFVIAVVVVGLVSMFIGQQTKPLSALVRKMRKVQDGNLKEFVEVQGTEEIQELSHTYNTMLKELNNYIEQMMQIQEEKRKAEIHALQMQINPHYIYNTLASIKWLIWQGDAKKSTKVVDAFISLLRNTISNTEEFVTVEQEIENLRNYILINQVRYGDAVQASFYISEDCRQYKVPKLILQPFVENAFFHGFPEGMQGEIQIFLKREEEFLKFEIVDDGVGISERELEELKNKERRKSEHFTGIGVNNVDDRIKMIYGTNYGIHIRSEEGIGTTITIRLPLREE